MKHERIFGQTCNIFISSTFVDMNSERNYLMKSVFPELKQWCKEHFIDLNVIDLRWGIREEDTMDRSTLRICLENIKESTPFFLCLFGERKGWIPCEEDFDQKTFEKFPFVRELAGKLSATEYEVYYVLKELEGRQHKCLFLKRDSAFIEEFKEESRKSLYLSDNAESRFLEQYINESGYDYIKYTCHKKSWESNKISKVQEEISNFFIERAGADFSAELLGELLFEIRIELEKQVELCDFKVKEQSLKSYLLNFYKNEIRKEFPDFFTHKGIDEGKLSEEARLQRLNSKYYLGKKYITELEELLKKNDSCHIVLLDSHTDTTEISEMILAHWILNNREEKEKFRLFYCMQPLSLTALCEEMIKDGLIPEIDIKNNEEMLKKYLWSSILLNNPGKKIVLVLHGTVISKYGIYMQGDLANACNTYGNNLKIVSWLDGSMHSLALLASRIFINSPDSLECRQIIENFFKNKFKKLSMEDMEVLENIRSYSKLLKILEELMFVESYLIVRPTIQKFAKNSNIQNDIFDQILYEGPMDTYNKWKFAIYFKTFVLCSRIKVSVVYSNNIWIFIEDFIEYLRSIDDSIREDDIREQLMYYGGRMENMFITEECFCVDTKDLLYSLNNMDLNLLVELSLTEMSLEILEFLCRKHLEKAYHCRDERILSERLSQIPNICWTLCCNSNQYDCKIISKEILGNYQYIKKTICILGVIFLKDSLEFRFSKEISTELKNFLLKYEDILKEYPEFLGQLLILHFRKTNDDVILKLLEGAYMDLEANSYLRPCFIYEENDRLIRRDDYDVPDIMYLSLNDELVAYNLDTGEFKSTGISSLYYRNKILGYYKDFVILRKTVYRYGTDVQTEPSGKQSLGILKAEINYYCLEIRDKKNFEIQECIYCDKRVEEMTGYKNGIEFETADGEKVKWLFTAKYDMEQRK